MRLKLVLAVSALTLASLSPMSAWAGPQEGRKAWMKLNCNGCHGDNGGGGMGPNVRHQEVGDIREAMNGDKREGGMRSYKGLALVGPTDAADIAAYLATIGTSKEPKWVDWWRH
ncbi:c-type cytochrome [Methylosinus sp. Sm6]|uniref:c-type cytochrome n=1 Tax=Methylosinus sp. Sm6 TaxID=2866948 RepID=UPI001C9936A0|nr:c-type cytochrome [Methylosinus sp. Sm6]MBY6243222.1 c-type cytochrome [Methylosinus sp. Sm6]